MSIGSVKESYGMLSVYNEKGMLVGRLVMKDMELVGYTSETITLKSKYGTTDTYNEKGMLLYRNR